MIRMCKPNKPFPPQVAFGDVLCHSSRNLTSTLSHLIRGRKVLFLGGLIAKLLLTVIELYGLCLVNMVLQATVRTEGGERL